jgi:hypothetical protein
MTPRNYAGIHSRFLGLYFLHLQGTGVDYSTTLTLNGKCFISRSRQVQKLCEYCRSTLTIDAVKMLSKYFGKFLLHNVAPHQSSLLFYCACIRLLFFLTYCNIRYSKESTYEYFHSLYTRVTLSLPAFEISLSLLRPVTGEMC